MYSLISTYSPLDFTTALNLLTGRQHSRISSSDKDFHVQAPHNSQNDRVLSRKRKTSPCSSDSLQKAKATLSHGLCGSDVGREKAPIIFVEEA
ncbi:Hypothetical protein FKW44_023271 [Caligus rogercresseyi]|uniref:Uncharacterized protein n=1 Tax=Caligus rogercresseyi TaxID=217165 RepID=A0A7T8GNS8_CALRO|nr:Hypothetical protein FKW44_023271 [Caligus rogercresseyi]